jgi:hypothetical protein
VHLFGLAAFVLLHFVCFLRVMPLELFFGVFRSYSFVPLDLILLFFVLYFCWYRFASLHFCFYSVLQTACVCVYEIGARVCVCSMSMCWRARVLYECAYITVREKSVRVKYLLCVDQYLLACVRLTIRSVVFMRRNVFCRDVKR